jgi:hypothetical protein
MSADTPGREPEYEAGPVVDLDADPGRKEVLAHYGFAVGQAQMLEMHLAVVVAMLGVPEPYDRAVFVALVEELNFKPLERLRSRLEKTGAPIVGLDQLREVIELRNLLVHRFFRDAERSTRMTTDAGRQELVAELDAAAVRFSTMAAHLRAAEVRLAVQQGITKTGVMARVLALLHEPPDTALAVSAATLVQGSGGESAVAALLDGVLADDPPAAGTDPTR